MVLNRRFASSAESDLTTPRSETCIIPGVNGRPEKESTTDVLQKHLDLPFDQYQKYRMVADVVERLREDAGPLRILDAGGEQDILRDFLPEDRVTVLDPRAAEEGAAALPYEEQAFDYAVSVDVYGRIEPGARDEHLLELRRVSQRGVLLAAPFDSDVVRGAERVAHEFRRALHRADDVGSLQYAGNGLPKLEEAQRFFEEREDTVFVLPNGYVPHWLAMTCLASYGSKLEGALDDILEHVNAFYYESMYKLDTAEPSYRHLLVSLKEPAQADLSDLASSVQYPEQRAPTSAALFGTLSAMLPLTTEVRQLNARLAQRERQLAQKEGALARREVQIDDLSRRLAEQINTKNTLIQTEQRVRELHRSVRDLNRSHNTRHNTLEQKNAALEQKNAALERRKDDLQQQLARMANSRGWRLLSTVSRLRSRISGSS
jgi:O-antigen biosynthesis protein